MQMENKQEEILQPDTKPQFHKTQPIIKKPITKSPLESQN